MLDIYRVVLDLIREMRPVLRRIEQQDRKLAAQMRDAMQSVALNLAEGSGQSAGHRRERFRTALGSAYESVACVEVADAFGYVQVPPEKLDGWQRVLATVRKLAR